MNRNRFLTYLGFILLAIIVVFVGIQIAKQDLAIFKTKKEDITQNNTTSNIPLNDKIVLTGYIVKKDNNYKLLGWMLEGDVDFDKYIGKNIEIQGRVKKEEITILVDRINILEQSTTKNTTNITTSTLTGKLIKVKDEKDKVVYKIGEKEIETYMPLSDFENQDVYAVVKNIENNKLELKEIYKVKYISGVLKEKPNKQNKKQYMYEINDYDIISDINLQKYINKDITLAVYEMGNGLIDKPLVTVIEVVKK